MSQSLTTIANLTPDQQLIAFNSLVQAGLQEAYDLTDGEEVTFQQSIFYPKIARCKMPTDFARQLPEIYNPDGSLTSTLLAGRLPRKDIIAQLMPLGSMEALDINGGGAKAYPLLREAQDIDLGPYEQKTRVSRWLFLADIHGTIAHFIRMLRRTSEKNADILLSKLLNNGNTASCWHTGITGKKFFDTSIPCDLASNLLGETFDNYFTATPLTVANLVKRISYGRTIKLGDGIPGGVNFDTLVIPPELQYEGETATMLQNIVNGGTNSAPGQPAGTAAVGENVAYVMRHVKNVVVADMLTSRLADGTGAGPAATWYLIDSRRYALGYARALGPQYAWQLNPMDTIVFEENEYRAKVNTWEGAGYYLPQYAAKCVGV